MISEVCSNLIDALILRCLLLLLASLGIKSSMESVDFDKDAGLTLGLVPMCHRSTSSG